LTLFQWLIWLFYSRITELLREDYFHGYISGKQAEVLLCNKPRGTFLVRFSANRWGQGFFLLSFSLLFSLTFYLVAISCVDQKGVVKHLVVQNDANKGFLWKKMKKES